MEKYISRAGEKLEYAINKWGIEVKNKVCADFGCNKGGFTGYLLKNGAKKIYAVDTGYGMFDWNLRNNPSVVVMERTNALHITLPEKMDIIVIDVGWTPQRLIIPNALKNLKNNGIIISLIKPHYEASALKKERNIYKGKLDEEEVENIVSVTNKQLIEQNNIIIKKTIQSPIKGNKAGNIEYINLIKAV